MEDSLTQATLLVARLGDQPLQEIADELQSNDAAPDIYHAMCRLFCRAGADGDEDLFKRVCAGYELVAMSSWDDETGETGELLAQLALIAWRHCRRFRTYPELKYWESRCVDHMRAQRHIQDFLSIPFSGLSDNLANRFLSDPAVVLSIRWNFEAERNKSFAEVAPAASALVDMLERLSLPSDSEERAFFMAEIALSASMAFRHLGKLRASEHWLRRSESLCRGVRNAGPLAALIELGRLALSWDHRQMSEVLACAPALRRDLLAKGMHWHGAVLGLMYAAALKETDHCAEARVLFLELAESPWIAADATLISMAILHSIETAVKLRVEIEETEYRRALAVVEKSELPWIRAQLQVSLGEYFRERARLDEAVASFKQSIVLYEALSMPTWAAYIQLLLAEVLIESGQHAEAAHEVLAALKVASRESVTSDLLVAISLLREAIRRSSIDREVLVTVRETIRQSLMSNRGA